MRTDVHDHAVPERALEFFAAEPSFGLRVAGDHHLSGGPEGEYQLEPAFYEADAKVPGIESHGLDAAVVSSDRRSSVTTPTRAAGTTLAELLNEGLAGICARRPDRSSWVASVPLQGPGLAADVLAELSRAGCADVDIGTSAGAKRLDEDEFGPFWTAAEDLVLPVMLHLAYQHPHPGFERFHLTNVIGIALEFMIGKVGVDSMLMGTDLPCDMATSELWTEFVAVRAEEAATLIAEDHVACLHGLGAGTARAG